MENSPDFKKSGLSLLKKSSWCWAFSFERGKIGDG
jgi:hypothetical protein